MELNYLERLILTWVSEDRDEFDNHKTFEVEWAIKMLDF